MIYPTRLLFIVTSDRIAIGSSYMTHLAIAARNALRSCI